MKGNKMVSSEPLAEQQYNTFQSEIGSLEKDIIKKEKMKEAIYGFAVGDALGVPYEFKKRETFSCETMCKQNFPAPRFFLPAGTWSDDTSLLLCVLDAIRYPDDKHKFQKFRSNAVRWLFFGRYSSTHFLPFDVGVSCAKGITAMALRLPYKRAMRENNNGNGGLMRILPVAFSTAESDEDVLRLIHLFNDCTHGHEISHIACLIYIRCAKAVLNGSSLADAISMSVQTPYFKQSIFPLLSTDTLLDSDEDKISSSGYVVNTLTAVFWCLLRSSSYKEAVLKAVNLGHDADTIAALVGGIAGMHYGYDDIPEQWVSLLKRKNLLERFILRDYSKNSPLFIREMNC